MFQRNYIEKAIRWSTFQRTVLDLGLLGQVFNRINWRIHSVHCQKGGQVRRVRWNNDQCEEPPHTTHNPSWHCSENRKHDAYSQKFAINWWSNVWIKATCHLDDVRSKIIDHNDRDVEKPLVTFNKFIKVTYEGEMSHPCCIKAPSAYQRLLEIVKSLVIFVLSTFHSAGLNLLTRNNTTLTPT